MSGQRIVLGEVYWIDAEALCPGAAGPAHPHVIVQSNELNDSRIETVVVCGLTTNPKRLNEPGNVWIEAGEGELPRASVALVSQISTVRKADLGARIGVLSEQRVTQIFAGMRALHRSFG